MRRNFFIVFSMLACLGCRTTGPKGDGTDLEATRAKPQIAGWLGDEFIRANRGAPGQPCPAVFTDEQSACRDNGGANIPIENCKFLCSVPYLLSSAQNKGKVIGFGFEGIVTAKVAKKDQVCAALVRPEEEACHAVGGKKIKADGCKFLCSKPIAERGKVAGYNFAGPQYGLAGLAEGDACPAILIAEDEACRLIRSSRSFTTSECKVLCSDIINPRNR